MIDSFAVRKIDSAQDEDIHLVLWMSARAALQLALQALAELVQTARALNVVIIVFRKRVGYRRVGIECKAHDEKILLVARFRWNEAPGATFRALVR